MRVLLLLLLLLAFSAKAQGRSKVASCGGSATVNVADVIITGCDKNPRYCVFKRGQNATMSLPFTTKTQINKVEAVVIGKLGPLAVPFPLPQPNGCINSGLSCPLQAEQRNIYVASLPVKDTYPPVSVTVIWKLLDEHKNMIVCMKFPVRLT